MSGDVASAALPEPVDAAMHALFALPDGEQPAAFARLLAAHPQHGPALQARWRAVLQEDAGGEAPQLWRYRIDGRIGSGGMGEVLAAHDLLLDRPVAIKLARGGSEARRRFANEARITAKLEHPGVVPVHDLGTGQGGRGFYVMRLVGGHDADTVFAAARASSPARGRALEVLLKVCDTVAFAHSRGIVHRDLKPANVRVGAFGEVYVMDWGLAKAHGGGDGPAATRGEPIGPTEARAAAADEAVASGAAAAGPGAAAAAVSRGEAAPANGAGQPDAEPDGRPEAVPAATLPGSVLGTPSYMPPERAGGVAAAAAAATAGDVYAVGAMLYQVLAGRAPYAEHGGADAILQALRQGPPRPLAQAAADAPPALRAICAQAMAREPAQRYPSMAALAQDLRAFLDARAVKAHRGGVLYELRLWVRRNRALAVAIAVAMAVAAAALLLVLVAFYDSERSRHRFRRLASVVQLEDAVRQAAQLYPPWPQQVPALRAWQVEFAEPLRRERERLDGELQQLLRRALPGAEPRFADVDDAILHSSLVRHAQDLAALFAADGLAARMQERLQWAATIGARSIDAHRDAWQAARTAAAADPRYGGLDLQPQPGLAPLGADPQSGLLEFVELRTGSAPQRGADGALQYADDSGAVLVLLPGGRCELGAQASEPRAAHYWPGAKADEAPVEPVQLQPFLLGKHELTQAQWQALAGYNPSLSIGEGSARRPVGYVTWLEAERVLRENGLCLPSEAQWEYACRAGAGTAWATGDDVQSLQGHANVADATAEGSFGPGFRSEPALRDGFVTDAPVGSLLANAFGLFDLHGNHAEWCLDVYRAPRRPQVPFAAGVRDGGEVHRVYRGGSYALVPDNFARCAFRGKAPADSARHDLGVRVARRLW